MSESLTRLDDMRLMAELLASKNYSDVARRLGAPKQTISRRIALLEESLGVSSVVATQSGAQTSCGQPTS
jgi:DNA-binding transcriptional LysR family regulator